MGFFSEHLLLCGGIFVARVFSFFPPFSLPFAEHGVALALLLLHTEEMLCFLEI
jgi:hypothetical protein